MAYERAFLSAVSQFAMDFYGQEAAKKIYNYYNDSSSDINESPVSKKAGGLKLKDALPPKEEMCMNFGVRLYYDDTGYPSLLSFGQYGAHFAGKSVMAVERAEEQALKQAQVLADSAMTMFINSFIRIGEESEMSEISSDDIAFSEDGNPTPESVLKTIDRYSQKIEQQGQRRRHWRCLLRLGASQV